jgi:hypothetical protein
MDEAAREVADRMQKNPVKSDQSLQDFCFDL